VQKLNILIGVYKKVILGRYACGSLNKIMRNDDFDLAFRVFGVMGCRQENFNQGPRGFFRGVGRQG